MKKLQFKNKNYIKDYMNKKKIKLTEIISTQNNIKNHRLATTDPIFLENRLANGRKLEELISPCGKLKERTMLIFSFLLYDLFN